MKRSKKTMTQSEYGRSVGVSQPYINKLIQKGIIRLEADGKIDPKKADQSIKENSDPSLSGKRKIKLKVDDTTYSKTRLQKETLNVLLLKLVHCKYSC
jgi:predicted transcriptional regulator